MQSTLELAELDSKIAQLFIVGMPGTGLDDATKHLVGDVGVGGIILFSRNIEGPIQLARLCKGLQELAVERQGKPLFLAIDQESGRVSRLKEPFTQFPGSEAISMSSDPEREAREFAHTTGREMALVGLNMNLAPVLDVPRGEPEGHLKGRTFGSDPTLVSTLGGIVIEVLQAQGIFSVAKHFPGLGAAVSDPHNAELTIEVQEEELKRIDLVPFRAAVEHGVSGIMLSHAVYPCIDPENPATLSREVIVKLLQGQLGFEGLIITDDLEMGAITKRYEVPEAAAQAFEAGADLLLICEENQLVFESIQEIRKRILLGSIELERLHSSTKKIKRAKAAIFRELDRFSMEEVRAYFRNSE